MRVWYLDNLVAFHDVEPDTSQAGVRLVIDEQKAAIVGTVGVGRARVMKIAVEISLLAGSGEECLASRRQAFGENLQALIRDAPTGGAAAVEYGDAHEFTHRGKAEDADLA